jgi:ABC-type phosphate transport system substrate-binding protein
VIGALAALAAWYMIVQFTPSDPSVDGYGTSFSNLFITKALEQYLSTQRFNKAPSIIYTNENYADFDRIVLGNGTAMFVAYDDPVQPHSLYNGLIAFPIAAAAIIPIVRFSDEEPNPPITEKFVLTRENLVGIYNGSIFRFCNLSDLNPRWNDWICSKETSNLTAWHREAASGTNFVFTSALASFSSAWRHTYPPGLTSNWPPNIGRDTVNGNLNMISAVDLRPFSIGYIPIPDFKKYMKEKGKSLVHPVDIANPSQSGHSYKAVSAMQPDSLQAAVNFASHGPSGNGWNQSLINLPCEECWPLSSFAYVVVREDYKKSLGYNSSVSVSMTVKFLQYVLNNGIELAVSNFSYVSPPKNIIDDALWKLSNIRFHGKILGNIRKIKYDILAAVLISTMAVIAAILRMTIPLCMKPKSQNGRPLSRVTRDEMFDEGSHHSLMRQILENDEAITSPRPPRLDDTLRKAMIDTGELTIQRQIGKGASGDVFIGTYIGAIVAIKRMLLPTNSDRMGVVENFVREASTMALLRHPNIVQFLGASVSPPYLYLITEYCTQGSLWDVLHGDRKRNLSRSQKRAILIDAALGIMYLHGKGIVHRDIKTHNLLVDRTGTVKVADFGTSATLGFNLRATGSENNMKTMVGTPEYVAPEVMIPKGKGYSSKADIYSFGIVAWEVWSCQQPYSDLPMIEILFGVTTNGIRPSIEVIDDPDLAELIKRCWAQEPEHRPTFDDILSVLRDLEEEND